MPSLIRLPRCPHLTWLTFSLFLALGSSSYGDEPVDVSSAQKAIKDYREAQAKKQEYLRNLLRADKDRGSPCQGILMKIQARESDTKPMLDALERDLAILAEKLKPVTDVSKEVQRRTKELKELETKAQQAREELKGLENRKSQIDGEVDAARQNLAGIDKGSKEKIADWLLRNYDKQFAKSEPIHTPTQTVQDLHTLFGVYTIVSPRKLEATEKSKTTVRFIPAIFTKDLFAISIKTGPVATSIAVPAGLEFKPGKVFGPFGARDFDLSEKDLVDIDPPNFLTWNWATDATDRFAGAKFEIQMEAKLEKTKDLKKASFDLPVAIEMDPGKTFLEKWGTAIGWPVSLLVAIVGTYLTHRLTIRRQKPPPPEKPKIVLG